MNNPGTVVLSVADLRRMKVEADVDETDVASIRMGQTATVKVDALPDTTLQLRDVNGAIVRENPVNEGDLFATIYTALGINPRVRHVVGTRPIWAHRTARPL